MSMKNHTKVFLALIVWCFFGLESIYAQKEDDKEFYETKIEELVNIPMDRSSVIGMPHPHPKGEWHFQYQYMDMHMTGTLTGNKRNSLTEVLDNFTMAPTKMHMGMHMGMIMYGLTKRWTLTAMAQYHNFEMDMIKFDGSEMKMESKGFGDTKVRATYIAYHKNRISIIANIGSSLPTGAINKTSINRMTGQNELMPYHMQLGSGTFDPLIDISFLVSTMKSSWGVAAKSTFRLHDNENGYHLGNQYEIMSGYSYSVNRWFSVTSRFDMVFWDNINGSDSDINPSISPNHRPDLRGGSRFDLSGGLAFKVPKGSLKGGEFIIDYRRPVYQDLEGPQMPVDHHFVLTFQIIINKKDS